jgi:hypothetical protein
MATIKNILCQKIKQHNITHYRLHYSVMENHFPLRQRHRICASVKKSLDHGSTCFILTIAVFVISSILMIWYTIHVTNQLKDYVTGICIINNCSYTKYYCHDISSANSFCYEYTLTLALVLKNGNVTTVYKNKYLFTSSSIQPTCNGGTMTCFYEIENLPGSLSGEENHISTGSIVIIILLSIITIVSGLIFVVLTIVLIENLCAKTGYHEIT